MSPQALARLIVSGVISLLLLVAALLPLKAYAQFAGPPASPSGYWVLLCDSASSGGTNSCSGTVNSGSQPYQGYYCDPGFCFLVSNSSSPLNGQVVTQSFSNPFSFWYLGDEPEPEPEPVVFNSENPSHWLQVIFWLVALGFGLHGYTVGSRHV